MKKCILFSSYFEVYTLHVPQIGISLMNTVMVVSNGLW